MNNKKRHFADMNLEETVALMTSADYKDRFKAEFLQVMIRYEKLKRMVEGMEQGTRAFKPTCGIDTYYGQLAGMGLYLCILLQRASVETVSLEEYGIYDIDRTTLEIMLETCKYERKY